ncbi:MAG: hypothetical protein R2852_03270 [Bacteroidia bacterium]
MKSQVYDFEYISIKTNLISLFNVGLETPVYGRISLESNIRGFSSMVFEDVSKYDFRVNLKYHFRGLNLTPMSTTYFMIGHHYKSEEMRNYPKQDNSYERGVFDAYLLALGIGARTRYVDFWFAAELPYSVESNRYTYKNTYGQITTDKTWKNYPSVSASIALNLINFRLR